MSARCVFCGDSPTTLEHIFSPKWVMAMFRPTDSLETKLFKKSGSTGDEIERTWKELPETEKGKRFGPKVKCACGRCNSEWMERLDQKVRSIVTPLALGEEGTVSSRGVELVATWATKIALVMDSGLGDEAIDETVKHAFRENPSPLDGSGVWIAGKSPTPDQVRVRALTLVAAPEATDVKGYLATFQVIHIVFQVYIPIDPNTRVAHRSEFAHFVHPFWPHGRHKQLHWPPPQRTWLRSDRDFENVADNLIGIA
jgi:hypothetical protein